MKHELFSHVILNQDLPEAGLCRSDLATVVERYPGAPGQEPGYEVEVFNAVGDTVAVESVRESQDDGPRRGERFCVRDAVGLGSFSELPANP